MSDAGEEALRLVKQLYAQLGTTPTGIGLVNGRVLVPINGEQTEAAGVPQGAANFYLSGGSLWMQVFVFDTQTWYEVELPAVP